VGWIAVRFLKTAAERLPSSVALGRHSVVEINVFRETLRLTSAARARNHSRASQRRTVVAKHAATKAGRVVVVPLGVRSAVKLANTAAEEGACLRRHQPSLEDHRLPDLHPGPAPPLDLPQPLLQTLQPLVTHRR